MKTTAEMIEVMQAYERGETVEYCDPAGKEWHEARAPVWAWASTDYRIKPKPIEGWVNVYSNGNWAPHKRRESAEEFAGPNRVRCVKVREVPDDD